MKIDDMVALSHSPTAAGAERPPAAPPTLTARAAFVEVERDGAVAAVVVDNRGRIQQATAAAAAMLGFEDDGLKGRTLSELGSDGWHWAISNALLRLASDTTEPFNLRLVGRSGRHALIKMIPRPRLREQGAEPQHLLVWREQRIHGRPRPTSASDAELSRLAYALLDTQDDQRSRVAQDLEEGVAPLVIAAKFFAEGALAHLADGDGAKAARLVESSVARLRDVLAELHRIAVGLRPRSLDDLGLLPTITWFCRDFGQLRPQMRLSCELRAAEERIPPELKLPIFRILEEALRNVGEHSGASQADVSLCIHADVLELRIEDNGVGFEAERILQGDARAGVGLPSIASRVDATRGLLEVRSQPGQGTALAARWPLPPAR
jgi:signal transduction histidine kinase